MGELTAILQGYTGVCALVLMYASASLILVATNHTVDRSARHVFLWTLVTLALILIADWINFVVGRNVGELRPFHLVSMSLTFAIAPVLPVLISNTIFPERYAKWVLIVLSVHAIFEFGNIFYPLAFTVDEANIYSRAPLYWVYMSSYCISSVYLVVGSIKASRVYQAASTAAVIAILVCMMGGVAIQIALPSVRMSWPAVIMAVSLYFQYYAEMVMRSDALTMLLNRHTYEEFLCCPTLPCTVVLLDVDNFKSVNDQYGHEYGDVALRTLAGIVRRVFAKEGYCYRSGGDEYVVILTRKATRRQSEVDRLLAQLERSIDKARADDPRLPGMSAGYAQAVAGDSRDIHDVVEAADKNMYENKRLRKMQHARG